MLDQKKILKNSSLGKNYADWFLDYASYVILERAVPHIGDGLKPVQRRIIHAMKILEDGRYNKVANIVGDTMKYHPHGDVSIQDAIIQLGQKDILIDPQGNWGNVITGDKAAASRYIEARLSPLALDVVFAPKVTDWKKSYDGRKNEPISFPVKFPLLLVQGVEGIAVGLSCKILPHNFIELLQASIDILEKKEIKLYPDFPQGGLIDVSEYNDGKRGGKVRVRAKIEHYKKKKNTLCISEIPFGTTSTSLIDSIISANDKGKIKISKVEDNTAENAEIYISIPSGGSLKATEDALYAFTDCEISISPNACVIEGNKPIFTDISYLLRASVTKTKEILKKELEIQLNECLEKLMFLSLEKIFIENRIYRRIEEAETWKKVQEEVWKGLKPHIKNFYRKVNDDDILRLLEIKIKRISKYNSFKENEAIKNLEEEIRQIKKNLKNLTNYAISYYQNILNKYSDGRERKTKLDTFEKIVSSKLAIAHETLYLDSKNGFAGYNVKRDGTALQKCSRMDSIVIINSELMLRVSKIEAKMMVGRNPVYIGVFKKNKKEQGIYTIIYSEGVDAPILAKRFQIGGVTHNKIYDIINRRAVKLKLFVFKRHVDLEESNKQKYKIFYKKTKRLNLPSEEFFGKDIEIKSRGARGRIYTPHKINKINII